ncbi:MAG: sulfite exporter TauE/SafE family protein [Spirochaetaceae bacterium]|jgi:sulfite exporter TauE/SafE/copper chaperone CopZ|nr:sulfite exporter TauE/SafE family protein [Spirochaetaceae bacterium]
MKTETIRIGGMTCAQCQKRIEQTLKNTSGIDGAVVDFNTETARISYNDTEITLGRITEIIEKIGYSVLGDKKNTPALEIAGILIIIIALYALLRRLNIGPLTSMLPLAETSMDYGMLFITGLATSLHCAAMCGGINLSQCINTAPFEKKGAGKTLAPALLYNGGRIISYTITGAIVGAVGTVINVSGRFTGLVQLAAGVFMVIMGINMLGFFPALRRFTPRLPDIFAKKINKEKAVNKKPLLAGILNGLMPCGPLQAMQLYALSTGSPVSGALSMFVFSIGTTPLMAGVGALSSLLSNNAKAPMFTRRVAQAGAVLVTVMGMTMLNYGVNLSGVNLDFTGKAFAAAKIKAGSSNTTAFTPLIENGVQIVNSTLSGGRYPSITVQQGIPVRWVVNAPAGSINGCNNRMIIREYGIEYQFKQGENIIEFIPARSGNFSYSCWMGMIRGNISVIGMGESAAPETDVSPVPAGVAIPTANVALAEVSEDGSRQIISTQLRDDGMDAAVLVVQRGVPALWTINNDSFDPGNGELIFPAYYTRIGIEQGDNVIQLMPVEDFDFSTADNVFYAYVKVVDDLDNVNVDVIREEAAEHETLIYPDAYFDAASGGGASCCASSR